MGLIVWILVGAIAGWLAGLLVRGGGFGFLANTVLGIIGAVVAGWVLPRLGIFSIAHGFVGQVVHAMIGAVIVLVGLSLLQKIAR